LIREFFDVAKDNFDDDILDSKKVTLINKEMSDLYSETGFVINAKKLESCVMMYYFSMDMVLLI
jgi:hypothetical protein